MTDDPREDLVRGSSPEWPSPQLGRLARILNGGTPTADDENWGGGIAFVTPPDIREYLGREIASTERTLTERGARTGSSLVMGGVVISNRAPIGYVAQLGGPAAFNQGCKALQSTALDPRFLMYALLASRSSLEALGQGTTFMEISAGALASVRIPCPPLKRQEAIVDFLDRETAKIDALIEKQRALVGALRDRARTFADRLVWHGHADMDRLPPVGWERTRNKNLLVEVADLSALGDEEPLSVSHLTGVTPRSEKTVTMIEADSYVGYKLVRPGDLVINTMWAWMGALGVSAYGGLVSPAYGVYRLRPGALADPGFLDALYRSTPYVAAMTNNSRGVWSSRLRLYPDVFLRMELALPPLEEQRTIARELEANGASTATLIAESERFVELAKERRSALITAAVKGQLDVTTGRVA